MNRLLIICGPTAIGKTALGIKLAKKFSTKGGPASGCHGEIISADSRQVYKKMDIGTGKDVGNSKFKVQTFVPSSGRGNSKVKLKIQNYEIGYRIFKDIRVWLVDVCEPDKDFNVAYWVKFASLVIEDIWKRKKLPIIVGGTGFWIKALLKGIESMGIPPDWKLRKKLSNYPIIQLSNLLKKLDSKKWRRMNESDRKNPRRLIRAIEISQTQNSKVKSKNRNLKLKIDKLLMIGLKAENEILYQRIDQRVDERVRLGVEREIRSLLKAGDSFKNSVLGTTIGYQEWQRYFERLSSKEEVIQRWKLAEHAYARRQMTWFKKFSKIKWFDIAKQDWQKEVVKLAKSWYSKI